MGVGRDPSPQSWPRRWTESPHPGPGGEGCPGMRDRVCWEQPSARRVSSQPLSWRPPTWVVRGFDHSWSLLASSGVGPVPSSCLGPLTCDSPTSSRSTRGLVEEPCAMAAESGPRDGKSVKQMMPQRRETLVPGRSGRRHQGADI